MKEMKFVQSLLPISKNIIETATFDPHALKNPAVLTNKWLYQKGINYGFANTKAYVLNRDGYCCQHCKGKSKDKRLEVHHIIFRSENGSDEEVFIGPVIADPGGLFAQIGTYIPFSAPGVLLLRLTMLEEWPWIEIIIALAVLLASVWLFMKLAGKIFKVGILMYGKNATPQEIWKWIRA